MSCFLQEHKIVMNLTVYQHLLNVSKFIKEGYFVIKNLVTDTYVYPYAITNIDQSLLIGLKEEDVNELYIPQSFRVKGNIFNKTPNENIFEIQYILCKTDIQAKYNTILYAENSDFNNLDSTIKTKINDILLG